MKKIASFLREYPVFALVAVAIVVGFGLQLAGFGQWATWIIVAVSAVAAAQIITGMLQTLREGGLGLDILALTAIVVGVLLGEYWAAVVIALMLTGGEALEDFAARRATNELNSLLDRAPKQAHVVYKRGHTHDVRVERVAVGDHILIKPGEVIPVDGQLTEGATSLDESSLTGESLPVGKQKGDEVMSGAVNVDAAITIRALRTSQDSQYAQIVKLVQEATTAKSPFVRLADRYSLPFSALSFGIAFTVWAISGNPVRFLEVIVVATPCPLLIGAPVAIISGMSRAAKHGIIIKNGKSLERLASVRSMAFDKTGTLTQGKPALASIETCPGMTENEVLSLAAAIESKSAHILAEAVVAAAKDKKLKHAKVTDVREQPGFGLRAIWEGKSVVLGNYAFLTEEKVTFPKEHKATVHDQTTTFVAVGGNLVGSLNFRDEVRPEAKQTLSELKQLGLKHLIMLTGDNPTVAKSIAQEVGMTEFRASLLPADKVTALKEIDPSYRPSGMVGDGVNDAPVLAASDVGIALGARGSTAASESADVVIMLDSLQHVAQAVSIAKRTIHIGLQSIWVGISLSVVMMLVFATGRFPAVLGAALQEVVDVVVIINALRAHGSLAQTIFARVRK